MSKKKTAKKNKTPVIPPKSKAELRDEAKARQIALKKAKIAAAKRAKAQLKAKERAKKKKIRAATREERLKKKFPYAVPPRNTAVTSWIIALIVFGLLFLSYFFLNPFATVIFDPRGGSEVNRELVWKGSVIDEPDSPVREGYVFDGWYTEPEFETPFEFTEKIKANITLYAKWNPFDFPINIILNGGGYAAGFNPINTFTIEDEIILPVASEMYREGYEFKGWYTDRDFIPGTEIIFIPIGTAKPVTIFAKWVEIKNN